MSFTTQYPLLTDELFDELSQLFSVALSRFFTLLAERAGFYLPVFCNIIKQLWLQFKSCNDKDLKYLVDLLFLHGFLPFRDGF